MRRESEKGPAIGCGTGPRVWLIRHCSFYRAVGTGPTGHSDAASSRSQAGYQLVVIETGYQAAVIEAGYQPVVIETTNYKPNGECI